MVNELESTINRKPVGVYIEETHKNRYHHPFVVEVCVFFYFFNNHDLTVGRSYDDLIGFIFTEISDGALIKVYDDGIGRSQYHETYAERNLRVENEP